jgi:hypothetical protein
MWKTGKVPVYIMDTYGGGEGNGSIPPLITAKDRSEWDTKQLCVLAALLPGKRSWYPLNRMLDVSQMQPVCGTGYLFLLLGIK